MNILVTGAAGFIGSHLCERLLRKNHKVVGLDNFDEFYDPLVKQSNISSCLQNSNFKFVEGDISNANCVEAVLEKQNIDFIIHLAAKAGVRPSIKDPLGYVSVNINGTVLMLEAAKKYDIKKFIFASSSSVYGNNKKVPFSETDGVDFPISPYAATKKSGELICYMYSHLYEMDITCLRFFTVYGPRQRPDLAIHKFARLIESGKPIDVFGDGSTKRDFTYIDNIIDGILAAINSCCGYEIYNLGSSNPIRLDELIKQIENVLGKKASVNYQPSQPGDVIQTYADITKAKSRLGYEPKTPLCLGLASFAEWLRTPIKHNHKY